MTRERRALVANMIIALPLLLFVEILADLR